MRRNRVLDLLERLEVPGRDRWADRLLEHAAPFERVLASGVRLRIHPEDRIERRFAIRSYERPLLRFLAGALRPGDTVIDGGAHVGYVALHAATHVAPGGEVFAVEPDPANVRRLRDNAALNALPVTVVDAALSEREGTAQFTRDLTPGETGWGSMLADPGERSEVVEVRTTTIDALAAGPTRPVRLVKLDVQGAEYDALRGAGHVLAEHRPFVVVETVDVWWGSQQTKTVADVRALLADAGYVERSITRLGRLGPARGEAATAVFAPASS